MSRKTIDIADLLTIANTALAVEVDEPLTVGVNRRWGVIAVIEAALFATDNYKGFRYLPSEYDPDGTDRILRLGYDETRRAYFGTFKQPTLNRSAS